jgi:hypothetical protein
MYTCSTETKKSAGHAMLACMHVCTTYACNRYRKKKHPLLLEGKAGPATSVKPQLSSIEFRKNRLSQFPGAGTYSIAWCGVGVGADVLGWAKEGSRWAMSTSLGKASLLSSLNDGIAPSRNDDPDMYPKAI